MPKRTVCLQSAAKLKYKDNHLVIDGKEATARIPLEDIWVLILESHEVVISTALLAALGSEGIGVIVCGRNHMPIALQLPLGAHSRHAAIVEDQLLISKPLSKRLWQLIIKRKIENQALCLSMLGLDGVDSLLTLAKEVRSGDTTGRESVAASSYFRSYLSEGTRREGPYAPLLDYGYAILRAGIARCAVSGGWLVSRGLHHCSDLNAFNLVDDLIEPFRPVVDLLAKECEVPEGLSAGNKMILTRLFECTVEIDGEKYSVQSAIEEELDSLKRAVRSNDASCLRLPRLCAVQFADMERR
ncbi:type II CRISPR-associated endonuclease Cas1 [Parvibacter caecicola]|uniref:type II CRISPR-associated endonuclease Cas1 n=1 Tax=Parvibacter caecicola TaxID=747645 RepID=UPI00145E618F|nr:type II CRISPR-associated endonuclease Cas1 [Parvibacter caecicola]